MRTINDVIIELSERNRGNTHWEGCERDHVDCAAILALTQFKDLALAADKVVYATAETKEDAHRALRIALTEVYAAWLLPLVNNKG